jgi:hypothetical protein
VAGVVVAGLLCGLGYLAVGLLLGDHSRTPGEPVAALPQKSSRPLDTGGDPGPLEIPSIDIAPPRPATIPVKPVEKTPAEKPPVEKTPAEKPALPVERKEAAPAPVEPPLVVKRRNQATGEDLRRQLLHTPELHIDRVPQTSTKLVLLAGEATRLNRKYAGHSLLLAQRSDLKGVPMRMGDDCHLGKEPAENMHVLSRKLRLLIQASTPTDGIDPRPDVAKLRELLLDADAQQQQIFARAGARFAGPAALAGRVARGGRPQDWLTPAAVPTLVQMLQPENTPLRKLLVEVLGMIKGKVATEALVNRALMDVSPEVRELALNELRHRPARDYRGLMVKALRYPWSPVADHASEALVTLGAKDAVPDLVKALNQPDPMMPVVYRNLPYIREVVKVNHLGNCVLCHAPSVRRDDLVRGAVPTPGQPLPAAALTPQYYERGGAFVRADITYLRQDFSLMQPVDTPGVWPGNQRFDYMVRTRAATVAETEKITRYLKENRSPQREAMLFALQELTGKNLGPKPEDWLSLLPEDQRPKKPTPPEKK